MKTYHILVEGRVQGVGFRYFVLNKALKYELKGSVENCNNKNRVEIYCQGEEVDVEELIKSLNNGPALSTVLDVKIDTFEQHPYYEFKII